ncbi:MAG: DNA-directed RNA polymerase subunit alpha [Candidatus Portnoybacteria bacterium CG10_big_fil_rev_8_21_14_0_10_44_7]|uniref:DNA-directed RNA polymerase subunit alpha n=1 Tax=Candidatus Portnoybacteria bacterium CG10_big_fil_rev_8_21_14_0_10_44_7 TaxID=1974816 RepID=A0A2M8KJ98_9BACT|nr:MAG: DNA-directed RNA polymerase subunit alpha [Candidatus Portnoybacteria bacterium CG10_big_fil_rev_8_21_14_0_10_44_7]
MISLPKQPRVKKTGDNQAIFSIDNCYPGYGITLGNAFRRVLLSSLPGVAVVGVKIKSVQHEFSTLKDVMEDVIEIIMNLKQVRFKMTGEERAKLELKVKGKKEVRADDIKTPGNVEIINKDQHIATLTTAKAFLEADIEIERGLGFVPVGERKKEKLEIGSIAVDAIFTPIKKVNLAVENMRVGDRTDYNRLLIEIQTDGSLTPQDAFLQAAKILIEQFGTFVDLLEEPEKEKKQAGGEKKGGSQSDISKITVEETKQLSTRTVNALRAAGIKTLGGLSKKTITFLSDVEGLGDKGLKEVKKALLKHDFEIKT